MIYALLAQNESKSSLIKATSFYNGIRIDLTNVTAQSFINDDREILA